MRLTQWTIAILLILSVGQGIALWYLLSLKTPAPNIMLAHARVMDVTDGDTFLIEGGMASFPELVWKIRIAGIDSPEMKGDCLSERQAAQEARTLLKKLIIANNNEVILRDVRHDKYGGRIVADVYTTDKQSFRKILLQSRLYREYNGRGNKPNWCVIL